MKTKNECLIQREMLGIAWLIKMSQKGDITYGKAKYLLSIYARKTIEHKGSCYFDIPDSELKCGEAQRLEISKNLIAALGSTNDRSKG